MSIPSTKDMNSPMTSKTNIKLTIFTIVSWRKYYQILLEGQWTSFHHSLKADMTKSIPWSWLQESTSTIAVGQELSGLINNNTSQYAYLIRATYSIYSFSKMVNQKLNQKRKMNSFSKTVGIRYDIYNDISKPTKKLKNAIGKDACFFFSISDDQSLLKTATIAWDCICGVQK